MYASGQFREDLFYRLHVFHIALPPLRDRREDIPVLAAFLLERHGRPGDRWIDGFTAEALSALVQFHWPGNVRELENVIDEPCRLLRRYGVRSDEFEPRS